jgi:hypothetical protein
MDTVESQPQFIPKNNGKMKCTFSSVLIKHSKGRWGQSLENGDCSSY